MEESSVNAAQLDALTGGVLSAASSQERSERLRVWLQQAPDEPSMQAVYKALQSKDQGAAKLLREQLDAHKQLRHSEQVQTSWFIKVQGLAGAEKTSMGELLACEKEAAALGLNQADEAVAAALRLLQLRLKALEQLEHEAQLQKEAAAMLRLRLDDLSTKALAAVDQALPALRLEVQAWMEKTAQLPQAPEWPSVDSKYTVQLHDAQQQMQLVVDAFEATYTQAQAALADYKLPLPDMPVWAEEVRQSRMAASAEEAEQAAASSAEQAQARAAAVAAVGAALEVLERELEQGHGKASVTAANAVRASLKEHEAALDAKTLLRAQAALSAAHELEGWQRWRANQIREDLMAKAKALLAEGKSGPALRDGLKQLRDMWKETDKGGMPNPSLWKQFDAVCEQLHAQVEAWRKKQKEVEQASMAKREALMAEVRAWSEAQQGSQDWRAMGQALRQFGQRWQEAGHVSNKTYEKVSAQWKALMHEVEAPLKAAQKANMQARHALIAEAKTLAQSLPLRVDAVQALQKRWQELAQAFALPRREENKLWDAFRKPLDAAFERKGQARAEQKAALSAHDQAVMDAAKALEAANASGDAQAIQEAMAALQHLLRGPASMPAAAADAAAPGEAPVDTPVDTVDAAQAEASPAAAAASEAAEEGATEERPASPQAAVKKPVVAMRGDDRPGAKKVDTRLAALQQAQEAGGRGKRGDKAPRGERPERFGRPERADRPERGPRLSGPAFAAQRAALEQAQQALRAINQQAHGASLAQLLQSWQARQADAMPAATDLGRAVKAATHSQWAAAIASSPAPKSAEAAATALLRLEMAADVPTPADQQAAKRQMQLQLLTQKDRALPADTWAQDVATVLGSAYEASAAKRLDAALRKLLRK